MIWRSPLDLEKMLLTGHIGKLVKVAGGIMNTHSREGDCRMEVLAAASVRNQVPYPVLEEILQCVTTEEAVRKLDACGKKRCCDAGAAVKNHVLSEQTGGRKNADRGYPLLQ